FIGSEGTLGIVTEAVLKLTRAPGALRVLLFAIDDLPGVLRLFREAKSAPFGLMAYEFFTAACLARVMKHRRVRAPLARESPFYVLIEAERAEEDSLEAWLSSLFDRGLVNDGVIAQHRREAEELWSLRESISESLSATGTPHKNDIALPIASLDAFTREL